MKYSVRRIETAKQKALGLASPGIPKGRKGVEINWTREDEAQLMAIIDDVREECRQRGVPLTHVLLNKAIDNFKFSGGTHHANAKLSRCVFADDKNGNVHVRDPQTYPWMDKGVNW